MIIDVDVHPDFYEIINKDKEIEQIRHDEINVHLNGTAQLEHIFNQMNLANIGKMFILGRDYSKEHGFPLVSNDEVKKIEDAAPDKFVGFASIDPRSKNAEDELIRSFEELDLKGLALYPARQHFYPDDEKLNRYYDICIKYNKPVIFHSGLSWEPNTLSKYGHPLEFENLANRFPNLRFCLTQFGWPWIRETAMLMVKNKNIYASLGSLYFDNAWEFMNQCFTKDIPITWIDRSLRHQVMFGSANPRFEQIRLADAVQNLGLRDSTVELIKSKNAYEFLKGINSDDKRGGNFVY